MERTRRELLREILEDDRDAFIYSLAGQNLKPADCRQTRQHAYFEARRDYDEMKKQGALPMFCHILENVRSSDHERLKGDIFSDSVYSFLKEVSDGLDGIAVAQYERGEGSEQVDPMGEDLDVYLGSKNGFLSALMLSMEQRSGREELACSWSDSAKINTSERYDYLTSLANLKGDERADAIRNLVKEFPRYPWENFYWPNENN